MKKTVILLILISVTSKICSFFREITLSYFYGASNISDAFLIAFTIPGVVFSYIGMGISAGYIPIYSKIEREFGEKEGNRYNNNLINLIIIICTILIIFSFIFTEQLVKLFASGFKGETLLLSVKLTRISIVSIYFSGIVYVLSAFLNIKGNYAVPALVGFILNFTIILSIFFSYKFDISILGVGIVISAAFQLLLLIPFAYKRGYRYKPIVDIKDEHIKNMVSIALPAIVGVSVNQINVLIDKTLASNIVTGGISSLNYADRLNSFLLSTIVISISTVMYPMLSKMAAEKNIIGLKRSVAEAINSISLLLVPTTIGAMIFSEPIVKFLFGRGAFNTQAISMTSNVLFFYSIGMIGIGLREILAKAFYSLQDTKTPTINATITVVMNVVLNLILSKFIGIGGLALATSISAIFCTGLLFVSFKKKLGPFGMRQITISFVKIMVASLTMGAIAKMSYNILLRSISANLSLIASIIVGAAVYFIIVYFMKIEEVDSIINAVKRKLKAVFR
jgi:putative peptidoglycan lipid II flippase